jgi:hypothetical protein
MGKQTVDAFSDLRGREPWSEADGRRVVDACESSGKSVPAFAKEAGLGARRIYWWRTRLQQPGGNNAVLGGAGEARGTSLVPVVVREAPLVRVGGATVWTREGHRVDVTALDGASAAWVAMVVRALEGGAQ